MVYELLIMFYWTIYILWEIILIIIFIYLYFNQLQTLRVQHASCHEMSERRRLVKLKDMKKEIFPFILLSCGLGHSQISALPGLHKTVASHSYSISSSSRVHPPGNTPCIPPHKPPPCIPIMHHSPCWPDTQTSYLETFLHGINPPLPMPTHWTTINTLSYIDTLSNPVILHLLRMSKPS